MSPTLTPAQQRERERALTLHASWRANAARRLARLDAALEATGERMEDKPPLTYQRTPSALTPPPAAEPTTRDASHRRTRRAYAWTPPTPRGQRGPRPIR